MPAVSKKCRNFFCGSSEPGDVHQRQLVSQSPRFEQHCCSRLIEHDEPLGVLLTCFRRLCLRSCGELHRLSLEQPFAASPLSLVLLTWTCDPAPRESYVSRTNCRKDPLAWGRDLPGNPAVP